MSGPYRVESSCIERCGSGPIRFRLPITGHGRGPGGSMYLLELDRRRRRSTATRNSATPMRELHGTGSSIRMWWTCFCFYYICIGVRWFKLYSALSQKKCRSNFS